MRQDVIRHCSTNRPAMNSVRLLTALFGLSALANTASAETKPLLVTRDLPVITKPSFASPLDAIWSIAHGQWLPKEGVLEVIEIPADKHVPVLHHNLPLQTAVIECEVMFEGPGTFLIGCDGKRHVGRAVVNANGLQIAEDSEKTSHVIASVKAPVARNEWHQVRVEWQGDEMAASLDGQVIRAQHPYLGSEKSRSWLAVGKSAKVRNLKISGEKAAAKP